MNKISTLIVSGVCSLGMTLGVAPAQASSVSVPTVAGVPMDQIQTVGHRSHRGGHYGGGRHGHRGWGHRGGWRHGGWDRGHRGYYGHGYRRHHRNHTGRYIAAGVLGLAAGAAIANSSRGDRCRYVRNGRAYYRPC
ncbi:hypothetical protein [Hansschlegelia beijingensis]|uniref:BA14K family protein n=1 Tax=Hansschlegelia beijingensis TaxID=1133344 RepID=A0A7W6GGB2_9HYPH|nr:hypothetical protein [Hansschlegelia beijingensis]MBB3973923.1 hypothetical protein [Hansschlegelia beijingensis]